MVTNEMIEIPAEQIGPIMELLRNARFPINRPQNHTLVSVIVWKHDDGKVVVNEQLEATQPRGD